MKKGIFLRGLSASVFVLATVSGNAQLKGDHLLGDFGLSAGTQAPPSIIVSVPFYWYEANKLLDRDRNVLDDSPDVRMFLTGVGGSFVTPLKVLGANYGATLLFAFASNMMEGTMVDAKSPFNFSDTYFQPVQLGWHLKNADLLFGYALYIPTGKYTYGGDHNSGLGMWTNEFSVGGTYYFDPHKTWNVSTLAFYEIHSKKKDSDTRTGNILTLEGGVCKTFYPKVGKARLPMPVNVGPVYYMQFKTTADKIAAGDAMLTGDKDHIYGMGLEVNALHPKWRTSLGLRWVTEMGAKSRFQGNTFMLTVGQILKLYGEK